jgi:predicted permease
MNWRRFFRRVQADAEQQLELESYIEITTEEYIAQGMGTDEARRAARLRLGNLTQIREEVFEMNTATFLEGTLRELRHTARMLRRNPAFSMTAIVTLALGIGATTAIFSVVNGVLIKPLSYPESDALLTVGLSAVFGTVPTRNFPLAPGIFGVDATNSQAFKEFGLWRNGQAAIIGSGSPEQVDTLLVTQSLLPTLGIQPALGRWFSREDDQPGTTETVILSEAYWERRFGGDPKVIGRMLTIDFKAREVIGVMPDRFTSPGSRVDLILPLRLNLAQSAGDFNYRGIARLKPGVTLTQANNDVGRMLQIWKRNENRASLEAMRLGPAARPLKEDVVGDVGGVLWVLLGGIGILLVIACANVANLLLVRAEGRGQELAVRTALGAGRGHIARALMLESLTLSLMGGTIGIALAYGGRRILLALGPPNLPRLNEIAIDIPVLAFAVAMSVLSGLLFGLVPIARLAGPKFALRLPEFVRGGGRGASAGKSQHRSQNALVVVQVALALVLLVSSGLMIRTFQNLTMVKPGFTDPATIQTVRISISPVQVAEPERLTRVQGEILQRLAGIPGVTSAAFVNLLPMDVLGGGGTTAAPTAVEGKDYGPTGTPARRVKFISPGLLHTLGTPLLAGRDVAWAELYDQRNVALVSETFARQEWGSLGGAIGKRIRVGPIGPWQEVIGVVADVYDDGVDKKAPDSVYWPAREHPWFTVPFVPRSVAFVLRSDRTGTEGLLSDIRQAVSTVNSDLAVFQVRSLREVYGASMARTSFSLVMLAIAGAMALLLGIVGIYGVLAYAAVQRRREVGIRLALGAQPGAVKGMFVYRGVILSAIGIALGGTVAAGSTRFMSSLLFGVTPVDAATFAAAVGVLVLAALAASYIPARRAAAIDPVETLREQ